MSKGKDIERYKHVGKCKGVLFVQVLDVDVLSDEIRFFTVTDGTLFIYCIHRDEDERHATHEVRIMVLDPFPVLKEIRVNRAIYCFSMSLKFTLPWCYQTIYTNMTVIYISLYIKSVAVLHDVILTECSTYSGTVLMNSRVTK